MQKLETLNSWMFIIVLSALTTLFDFHVYLMLCFHFQFVLQLSIPFDAFLDLGVFQYIFVNGEALYPPLASLIRDDHLQVPAD